MLRIQRLEERGLVVVALSGRLSGEHEAQLQDLLAADAGRRIVLDLADVIRVDRAGVLFLARCEANGTLLANCPGYVREWILTEGGSNGQSDE